MYNVLVVNPNGSTAITDTIKAGIDRYAPPHVSISYWTCIGGPPVLQSQADIDASTTTCLEKLVPLCPEYDGFLVACYADHSLVKALQAHVGAKPVTGIFEASIAAALDLGLPPPRHFRFAILTTGKPYEKQLEQGVMKILQQLEQGVMAVLQDADADGDGNGDDARFAGVVATGIGLADYEQPSRTAARAKMTEGVRRVLQLGNIGAICIGGVILHGTEHWVREICEAELGAAEAAQVVVVDQFQAGIQSLHRRLCCADGNA
ncbi:hypothetical protein A1O3_03811 [Capronia epimyces CBS 606.96]|uniref:Asp/Glu/hydantoin racemase n=1 Tax=Capronia epimyces CBS 606.96 TaxID=1182542 RepID=W9Y255_9EURO|nr:uncharacterized protein A1O3_03811 [Capronia epimyces CBS 606.96]EXJ86857.1 hypothetical protein A1O3_03811 [Capronia epimyces CBS 606.96]